MSTKKLLITVVGVICVIAAGAVAYTKKYGTVSTPSVYDSFAQCLTQKGAKFYGAFWCPHCQNQKKMFGSAATYLPYVECSTPDGQGQMQECADAKIKSYPTWVFADGAVESGEVTLQTLAARTSCELPVTLN
jgi:hypothetical protein